jgi:hypothetical protein
MWRRERGAALRRSMATVIALARVLVVAALIAVSCVLAAPAGCGPVEGGRAGTTVQLRYAAAGEGFVAFTFGRRAGATGFDVPAYRTVQRAPGDFEVELRGVFTRNPDGSPSYDERPMTAIGFSDVRLAPSDEGTPRWSIRTSAGRCPVSFERMYTAGTTFPRAQVFVAFGTSGVTVEPPCAVPGEGVAVSGVGFLAGGTVLVDVDGGRVHESKADAAGVVQAAFLVPSVPAGPRRLSVRDVSGRTAAISLQVLPPERYGIVRPSYCPVE